MAKIVREYIVIAVIFVTTVYSAPSPKLAQSDAPLYIEDKCGKVVQVDTYISFAKRASITDKPQPKCKVTLNSTSMNRLFIVFENADMTPKTGSQCATERVDVYDGDLISNSTLLSDPSGLCGKFSGSYNSTGSNITVLYTSHTNRTFGFKSVLTPFRSADQCDQDEFQCYTGNSCINVNLRCDGNPNCADKSDEMDCTSQEPTIGPLVTTNEVKNGTTNELTTVWTTEEHVSTMNSSVMPYIGNATAVSEATTVNTSMATDFTAMTETTVNTSMVTMVTENVTDITITVPSNSSLPNTTPESPVTTASPSPQGSDPHTGGIVGGIIGGLVFIAIVGGVFYYCKKKRTQGFGETAPLNN